MVSAASGDSGAASGAHWAATRWRQLFHSVMFAIRFDSFRFANNGQHFGVNRFRPFLQFGQLTQLFRRQVHSIYHHSG